MAVAFQCSLLTGCLVVGNSGSILSTFIRLAAQSMYFGCLVSISLTMLIFDRQIRLSYSCYITHIAKIYLVGSGINHCLHWKEFCQGLPLGLEMECLW